MKQLLAMMFLTMMPMALSAQGGAKPKSTQSQATIDAQIKTLKDSLKLYKDDIEFKKGALKAHHVQFDVRDYGHTPEQKGASKSLQLKWLQQELAAERKEFLYLAPIFEELFITHKCDNQCDPNDYIIDKQNRIVKTGVRFTAPEIKKDGETGENRGGTDKNGGASRTDEKTKMFDVVEEMPSFTGGQGALMAYLSNNIVYPKKAMENGVQGRVICTFVVERDGSITDVKVSRSVDPLLDKEAVRVLSKMPKWTPGKQKGEPVRVKYTVPVTFRLQ